MSRATSILLRRAAGVAVGLALAAPAAPASARASLADAIQRWYRTDPAIVCVSPQGRPSRCPLSDDLTTNVSLDPEGSAAVVFLTWLTDPTGNAEGTAAAVFRDGPDGWRITRRLPGIHAKPAGKVVFRGDTATFTIEVMRPDDARCCPTGRKAVRVDLR